MLVEWLALVIFIHQYSIFQLAILVNLEINFRVTVSAIAAKLRYFFCFLEYGFQIPWK